MTRVHLNPAFGNMQLRLVTRDAVQSFLTAKLHTGLSWKTVKHMRTVFGTVMAAAEIAELIPSNPVRKTRFPRRGVVKEKPAIAPEKIRELLDALPEPSSSLARLLVFTGLRIGELLALRWQDIDLEHGVLRVRRTVYDGHFDEPKTQRSRRTVPVGAKPGCQLAFLKNTVMVSRFAKGRNPRLMPEWDVSVMTSQPSLSTLARCRSIVCIVGKNLCR